MRSYRQLLLGIAGLLCILLQACTQSEKPSRQAALAAEQKIGGVSTETLREQLVQQIEAQGVTDEKVLAAMRKVQRHEFVPKPYRSAAYEDRPLPIGMEQTISQPFIVAYMTQMLELKGGEKVLEVGTGSGYQAAVLAEIAKEVYTIEILEPLARNAEETLGRLGYKNVFVKAGDGYQGWPEHAPFDAIIVTAAPDHVPQPLVEQLKVDGRMVIPVGEWGQRPILITKDEHGVREERDLPVLFVPMTGEAQRK
jgi:protein-L-isoaspartate(D-aspartate) O-methyltransferase